MQRLRPARFKSLAINLGVMIASTLTILFVAEVVLKFTFHETSRKRIWHVRGSFRLDKDLIYSIRPNSKRTWTTDEFTEYVETNSIGLRDGEIRDRSRYEKRLLILGDSMTFGHGVGNAQAYPNQLEAIFRQAGRVVDVINAGVKGYGTDQSYRFFHLRLRSLKPDVVIFAVNTNDVGDNISRPLFTIEDGRLVPLDARKNWLYLLGFLEANTPRALRKRHLYRFVASKLTNRDLFSLLPDVGQAELEDWARQKTLLEIAELQRMAAQDGFRLLVISIPRQDSEPGEYDWLHAVEGDGVWLYDASRDEIWQRERDRLYFNVDGHYSVAGNRVMAEKLYETLARNGE